MNISKIKPNIMWNKKVHVTSSLPKKESQLGVGNLHWLMVVGNVQWVHKTINIMKNKLPDSVFIDFCKKVASNNQ